MHNVDSFALEVQPIFCWWMY